SGPRASVRLDVRAGPIRPASYDVPESGFLIGSVPGCDIRLPGTDLPPVICLIVQNSQGATLRKLVPTYSILLNGRSVSTAPLTDSDQVILGGLELVVRTSAAAEQELDSSRNAKETPGSSEGAPPEGDQQKRVQKELPSQRQQLA